MQHLLNRLADFAGINHPKDKMEPGKNSETARDETSSFLGYQVNLHLLCFLTFFNLFFFGGGETK